MISFKPFNDEVIMPVKEEGKASDFRRPFDTVCWTQSGPLVLPLMSSCTSALARTIPILEVTKGQVFDKDTAT